MECGYGKGSTAEIHEFNDKCFSARMYINHYADVSHREVLGFKVACQHNAVMFFDHWVTPKDNW